MLWHKFTSWTNVLNLMISTNKVNSKFMLSVKCSVNQALCDRHSHKNCYRSLLCQSFFTFTTFLWSLKIFGLSFRLVAASCWLAEDDDANQKPTFFVQHVEYIYSMCNLLITVKNTSSLLWRTACATHPVLVACSYIGNSEDAGILQVFFWIRKKMKLVGLPNWLGVRWSLPL